MIANDRDQRLRDIAHRIWEEEGRPWGEDPRHWELAEAILADEEVAEKKDHSAPPALEGEDEA